MEWSLSNPPFGIHFIPFVKSAFTDYCAANLCQIPPFVRNGDFRAFTHTKSTADLRQRRPTTSSKTATASRATNVMTVSDIGKIVSAVTATQLVADLLSRRYIFQSERYKRQVTSLERAKGRRDKTVAAIAAKQSTPVKEEPKKQKYVPPSKKQTQQTSQKSLGEYMSKG